MKITNTYLLDVMQRRGWSAQLIGSLLAEFRATTYDVTLRDFLEAKP